MEPEPEPEHKGRCSILLCRSKIAEPMGLCAEHAGRIKPGLCSEIERLQALTKTDRTMGWKLIAALRKAQRSIAALDRRERNDTN